MRPSREEDAESDVPKSKEEVLAQITEVRDGLESGLKDHPLYPRRWMQVDESTTDDSKKKLRVMQFNILAEGLSGGEGGEFPKLLKIGLAFLKLIPPPPHPRHQIPTRLHPLRRAEPAKRQIRARGGISTPLKSPRLS